MRTYTGVHDNMANCLFILFFAPCLFALFYFPLLLCFSDSSFVFSIWRTTFAYFSCPLSLDFFFILSLCRPRSFSLFLLFSSCLLIIFFLLTSMFFLLSLLSPISLSTFSPSIFLLTCLPSSLPLLSSLSPPLQSPSVRMCGWWCSWCCCWCQQWLCLYSSTSALWATTAVWLMAKVRGHSSTHTKTHT